MTQTTQGATSQGPATTDPHRTAEAVALRPQTYEVIEPPQIEAMCWQPADPQATGGMVGWLIGYGVGVHNPSGAGATTTLAFRNDTGYQLVEPGDWVIRGTTGMFFRCDQAEFGELYRIPPAPPAGLPATAGDDARRLTALAERYRLAMHGQHASITHLLDPCDECQRAIDECDGSLACAEQRGRDAEYRAALTPAEATPLATPERETGTEHVEYAVQANFADATGSPWTSSPAWSRREQAKRQLTEWLDNDDNEPGLVLHVVQRTVLTGAWRTADPEAEPEPEPAPAAGEGQ